jgi:hypothetical protein
MLSSTALGNLPGVVRLLNHVLGRHDLAILVHLPEDVDVCVVLSTYSFLNKENFSYGP